MLMTRQMYAESLAERLRARQAELGLDQASAARRIGVDRSVYGRWVSDRKLMLPCAANIDRVAVFLDISRDELLEMLPASYRVAAQGTAEEIAELKRELEDLRRRTNAELEALRADVLKAFALVDRRAVVDLHGPSLLDEITRDIVGDVHLVS
jgi:transcriptional regulator with XRE-family HTH domain